MAEKCTRCGFNQMVSSRVNRDCDACFFAEEAVIGEWTMDEWEYSCGQNDVEKFHAEFTTRTMLLVEEE